MGGSLLFPVSVLSAVCAWSSAVGSWSALVVVPPGRCGSLGGVTVGGSPLAGGVSTAGGVGTGSVWCCLAQALCWSRSRAALLLAIGAGDSSRVSVLVLDGAGGGWCGHREC